MFRILLLVLFSTSVWATPQQELLKRINHSQGFSAQFEQQVVSPTDEVLMEAQGQVELARPNLFRWTMTVPNEELMVSDGQSLWYYSPFIEQVSIFDQQSATAQTPFVLLTRHQKEDWDKYTIEQQGDRFIINPRDLQSNQGQFYLDIDSKGVVKGFTLIEQDGQQSRFILRNFLAKIPAKERFSFTIPDGVEVDDQRAASFE